DYILQIKELTGKIKNGEFENMYLETDLKSYNLNDEESYKKRNRKRSFSNKFNLLIPIFLQVMLGAAIYSAYSGVTYFDFNKKVQD
ncbi:hypothetical protein ACI3PL_25365, partial [Lacticaseibacillus paracasei]